LNQPELELEKVHISYGPSHIIFGISAILREGEVVCFLGRNGVGKTTTLLGVMGINPPFSGNIIFKGKDITRKPPFVISRAGIGYVPEERRIFQDLNVLENLKIGQMKLRGTGGWSLEKVYTLFPALK
jgi:branched-chain amino acid transport system ATP-binding protein